jgi:hypothetical protein
LEIIKETRLYKFCLLSFSYISVGLRQHCSSCFHIPMDPIRIFLFIRRYLSRFFAIDQNLDEMKFSTATIAHYLRLR